MFPFKNSSEQIKELNAGEYNAFSANRNPLSAGKGKQTNFQAKKINTFSFEKGLGTA